MITHKQVQSQLKQIKSNYTMWGSTEVAELPSLLIEGEEIAACINGYYSGGFGLLVATNFRVLIVDKKPFTLNVEDLRYDMITEVNYNAWLILATLHIALPTRTIFFTSWSMDKLHDGLRHVQRHVMDARNGGTSSAVADPRDNPLLQAMQPTLQQAPAQQQTPNYIAQLARSAMNAQSEEEETPQFGFRASQRGVNPYSKIPSLARRRRYPAFYTPT